MMRLLFRFLHLTGLWNGFAAMGMLVSRLIPMQNQSELFFFFPYYHIGGAEKVHAAILDCFAEVRPWVIVTRRSQNANYRPLFEKSARLFDLWYLGFLYPISVGLAAGFVNRHENPVVFGCNSPFYYYLVPHLREGVRKIDLTHAFDGLERLSFKVAGQLDARITINARTVNDFSEQYRQNGADLRLLDRIILIENGVDIPSQLQPKPEDGVLRVLYVGRGTCEKRAHLVGRVASRCQREGLSVQFTLVGRGLAEVVEEQDWGHCIFAGEISSTAEMQRLYAESDILLLTSSREGFPLVIMEAMAHSVIPISTDVGGISIHVNSGGNGYLVDGNDEESIVQEMASLLMTLNLNHELRARISRQAYDYACANFSTTSFCEGYRRALLGHSQEDQSGR